MVFSQLGNQFGDALDFATPASNSFNFMDYVNKGLDFGKDGFKWFNNNSQGIGALGGLYGAFNQQSMANKMFGMQKDAFDYNKMLSEEERKRRDQTDTNFAQGFANSSYGKA